ncbi:hypothetical protein [Microbacterium sp. A93]|uniref:hypothetical protein n=1 Tax=Microbacterium sp. A93 TaxID=3450716 RepID=UPI003F426C77
MDETVRADRRERARRLHPLEGLIRVMDDPHRFLDIMLAATDASAAEAALQEQFGLTRMQAQAAINLQFRSLSEWTRQAIRDEAAALRD